MASVLETFVLLFDADTSKAKAGVQDVENAADRAAKAAADLDKSLTSAAATPKIDPGLSTVPSEAKKAADAVKAVEAPVKDVTSATVRLKNEADRGAEALVGMAKGALGAFAAVLAVGDFIGRAFESVDKSEQVGRISKTLDVAVEDLDAFGKAAVIAGGDVDGAFDSLTDLAEKAGEAMSDVESQASKSFSTLKISLKDANGEARNSLELMLQLADATAGMDRQSAIFQIKQLGVTDNRTIDLILKGRKEIEQLIKTQKALGVTTKEDVEIAQRYKLALANLNTSYDSVATRVASTFLPALTQIVDWLRSGINWARENSGVLKGAFIGIAGVLAAVYLPAMISTAAATLAATWPILVIGAAVAAAAAAFGLLYDDVMTFLDGGDSFIGQVSEKWPIVGEMVKSWAGYLALLRDVAVAVFGLLSDLITQPTAAWGNFTQAVDTAYQNFIGKSELIKTAVGSIGEAFSMLKGFVTAAWDAMIASITRGFDVIMSGVNKVRNLAAKVGIGSGVAEGPGVVPGEGSVNGDVPLVPGMVAAGKQQLATIANSPIAAQTSNSIATSNQSVSRRTEVSVGTVNVQTQATDADGMASAAAGSLMDQLGQAADHFDDGVAR